MAGEDIPDFRFQYLLIILVISHRIKIIKFLEPM